MAATGSVRCPEVVAAVKALAALPALAAMRLDITCSPAGLDPEVWRTIARTDSFPSLRALRLASRDSSLGNEIGPTQADPGLVTCGIVTRE